MSGPIAWPSGPNANAESGMTPMNAIMNSAITRPAQIARNGRLIDVITSELVEM